MVKGFAYGSQYDAMFIWNSGYSRKKKLCAYNCVFSLINGIKNDAQHALKLFKQNEIRIYFILVYICYYSTTLFETKKRIEELEIQTKLFKKLRNILKEEKYFWDYKCRKRGK